MVIFTQLSAPAPYLLVFFIRFCCSSFYSPRFIAVPFALYFIFLMSVPFACQSHLEHTVEVISYCGKTCVGGTGVLQNQMHLIGNYGVIHQYPTSNSIRSEQHKSHRSCRKIKAFVIIDVVPSSVVQGSAEIYEPPVVLIEDENLKSVIHIW